MGAGGGWLLWQLINRIQLADGLYPILALSGGLIVFSTSNYLGGSGILSVYLVGLLLGNKATRGRHAILNVFDGMTWLSQIGMFLVLGLLLTPSELTDVAIPALALAFGMILIARPISVWLSLLPFKSFSAKERWFISWVGLRGAVPIILAVFPMMAGLPNAQLYFNVAFFVVLVSLLVQGCSLGKASRLAKVDLPPIPSPISRAGVEIYPKSEWELFVYHLSESKWCVGEPLRKLNMPEGTHIAALYRSNEMLHPSGSTILNTGDILCVLGHEKDLDALGILFSEPPMTKVFPRFFGDFFLGADIELSALAPIYGLKLNEKTISMSVGELIKDNLAGEHVVGDQFEWQSLHWIVCELEQGVATTVGIRLPSEVLGSE